MKNLLSLTVLSLLSAPALAGHSNTLDDDSCWDAKNELGASCITVDSTKWSGDTFYVKYKNTCSHRIYARYCNDKKNGGEDCGSDGIRPGATKTWYTYEATGRYSYRAIGADKPSKDWVCAGKVPGWND